MEIQIASAPHFYRSSGCDNKFNAQKLACSEMWQIGKMKNKAHSRFMQSK